MKQMRRARRAKWRNQIRVLAQSADALQAVPRLDRAERRRRARDLWCNSTPGVIHAPPRFHHWMSKRLRGMQIGLMAIHNHAMTTDG